MSEVKRYWIEPSRLLQEGWHLDDTCVVKDWAYDRVVAERDALQLLLNDRDEQLHTLEQSRRSHFENSQAAESRIDELTAEQSAPVSVAVASRDESIYWLKRIGGIDQSRADLIYSMGFRRQDIPQPLLDAAPGAASD
ncbi:hypothetical protein EQV97_14135 [Pseudomonas sp. TMW22090]|uniref:hypothetical protein n=1 Tax=Pseudomonas sp. TMW22090 TaxID=2506434 RepID=UPI001F0D864B|nr:hypothetical protein [Pseudomonas sp. TMW22090]MCH4878522.1 hypothetical protein [Pseudomonas sp. TMW22090]